MRIKMKCLLAAFLASLFVLLGFGAVSVSASDVTGTLEIRTSETAHKAFYSGYEDGTIRPEDNITRAEVCQLLYRLLSEQPESSLTLKDVEEGSWYEKPVKMFAEYNIIDCDGGKARPDDPITRGELVLALTRLVEKTPQRELAFKDIQKDEPYYKPVGKAAGLGWIQGYDDGTFRPDNPVTRAEAAKTINRAAERTPDQAWIDAHISGTVFADLSRDHWAYYELMEASVPHETGKSGSSETEEWISADLTSFAVKEPEPAPAPAPAPEPVPAPAPAPEPAPAPAPAPAPEPEPAPAPEPVLQPSISFVFDGNELYAVNEKGEYLKNTTIGNHLYFGWDGRYTCGDATVDTYVKNTLAAIVTSSMSRDEKLRTAYYYVRDGFYYRRRNYYNVGATGWELEEARTMFETYKGNCYNYTAALTMIARQLGYDADAISGLVGSDYQSHGWVEITIDGLPLIFDTTLESSYVARGYDYNFYKLSYAKVPWPYVK